MFNFILIVYSVFNYIFLLNLQIILKDQKNNVIECII